MMANFLGLEVFNRGIEHYLRKHQFGNAKQAKRYLINQIKILLNIPNRILDSKVFIVIKLKRAPSFQYIPNNPEMFIQYLLLFIKIFNTLDLFAQDD
jgi:hypothetical protein